MRLLTDTCAAIKLVAFGDKLFKAGLLTNGDLVLHPRVFNETRKWLPDKKEKYKRELELLLKIKATAGLKPPTDEAETLNSIIFSTMDELGSPIGAADREQLIAAIYSKAEVVTNDAPFSKVAEALDVVVHTAERIVIEAHTQNVITKAEVIAARATWTKNSEKAPTREEARELDGICR
jgi:hypothetical protein